MDALAGRRAQTTLTARDATRRQIPSIYKVGPNARQIAYLLTGVSTLARLNGYGGLCLLVDEAELFAALPVPAAQSVDLSGGDLRRLARQQNLLQAENFPQHRWRDYPIAYDQGQGLFFLFTVTRSDNRIPLRQWLTDEQIFHLDPQVTPQEVQSIPAAGTGISCAGVRL